MIFTAEETYTYFLEAYILVFNLVTNLASFLGIDFTPLIRAKIILGVPAQLMLYEIAVFLLAHTLFILLVGGLPNLFSPIPSLFIITFRVLLWKNIVVCSFCL